MKAAAAQVLPDAKLTAFEQRAVPGEGARLVTTLTRHPGGAAVQVHARIDESFTLVYDAVVAAGGSGRGVADCRRRRSCNGGRPRNCVEDSAEPDVAEDDGCRDPVTTT